MSRRYRTEVFGELSARRAVFAAAVLLALLVGSMLTLSSSLPDLAYAARWKGTPGVLTVNSCARLTGRGDTGKFACEGVFRSDDGLTVDPTATMVRHIAPGRTVVVQRTDHGGYARVGASAVLSSLAIALFGVVMAGTVLLVVLTLCLHAHTRRGWWTLGGTFGAGLLAALASAIAQAST